MSQRAEHGVWFAIAAALLFGVSAPLAKLFLDQISPLLLAALLYLGSGLGLGLLRLGRGRPAGLNSKDWLWLALAILAGGVLAPVLLLWGLARLPASGASLLLNAEGVFTALLAWFVFRENFDRRIAWGMAAIVAGTLVLSWPGQAGGTGIWPALAVLAACLGWAIDNNLTRKVALADASFIAMSKGLAAGGTNLILALALGTAWPAPAVTLGALTLGFFSYGASLTLFVLALRYLGTARTGAYFAAAPFFGAGLALLLLHEPVSIQLILAAGLMALGLWLHLSENHEHEHEHQAQEHNHRHRHDDGHHQHSHDFPVAPGTSHSHMHVHEPLRHSHRHYPDAHHQHRH